jgi:cellulose synthase/poly-beta-1,6-N-acetylglucosamine synthase-like glycosyltransferase
MLGLERLVEAAPMPQLALCVVVPAKDEVERIGATLRALAQQTDLQGRPLDGRRYEVIVLANNCRDDTAALARYVGAQHPQLVLHVVERRLPAPMAHVGTARRLLMDEAWRRLCSVGRARGVIATTDADTCVAPTWVAATLHEVARGAEAVGGEIVTSALDRAAMDAGTRTFHERDVWYQRLLNAYTARACPDPADPWPRHYHHTGASLALTARAYARVGGIPALPCGEDVALYRELVAAGLRFRHSPLVRVMTSARAVGRAPAGMADTLHSWETLHRSNKPLLVEPWQFTQQRLRALQQLRAWWQAGPRRQRVRVQLGADWHDWLKHEGRSAPSFAALASRFVERQRGEWSTYAAPIEIDEAISLLRGQFKRLRLAA